MLRRPLGRTGIEVPRIGFGTAELGQEYGVVDLESALAIVPRAIDAGFDFLDTSPYYGRGQSEVLLGFALRGIPRERYTLCTKLGRYGVDQFDFSARRVVESVDASRHRLGVDCLDVVLCHDVEFVDLDIVVEETIPRLRDLQRAGKLRAVGVSGYPLKALREVAERTELDVVLSYGNLTLHNRSLAEHLPFFAERGIGVINAAPFDMRLLTDQDPPPWHPAPPELRAAAVRARAVCAAHGASLAQLAFQFATARHGPATTVVGTVFTDQLDQWRTWSEQPLDEELLAEVQAHLHPDAHPPRIVGLPENN